jgi:hypothetical protein
MTPRADLSAEKARQSRERQLKERLCPINRTFEEGHYGKQFVPKRKDQVYCSKQCQQAAANARRKEKKRQSMRAAKIAELGGCCSVCSSSGKLWIYGDRLLCGKHRSERNRQGFYRNKGWEPGKPGYERYRIRIFNIHRAMQHLATEKEASAYIQQWFAEYPDHLKERAYAVYRELRKDPNFLRRHLYAGDGPHGAPIYRPAKPRSLTKRAKVLAKEMLSPTGGESFT